MTDFIIKLRAEQRAPGKIRRVYDVEEDGQAGYLSIDIRWNDECGNGHNTFSITGSAKTATEHSSGCIHDAILKYLPEYKQAIRFHLWSGTAPMYYIENTVFQMLESDSNCKKAHALREELVKEGFIPSTIPEEYAGMKSWEVGDIRSPQMRSYMSRWVHARDLMIESRRRFHHARGSAAWPTATRKELRSKEALEAHLPIIQKEFAIMLKGYVL